MQSQLPMDMMSGQSEHQIHWTDEQNLTPVLMNVYSNQECSLQTTDFLKCLEKPYFYKIQYCPLI